MNNKSFIDFKNRLNSKFIHSYVEWEKFHNVSKNEQGKKVIPQEKWPKIWKIVDFKTYLKFPRISLNHHPKINGIFKKILVNRSSARNYKGEEISINDLSAILKFSAGIRKIVNHNWSVSLRYYPSGGARYPLEVYPIIFKVKGIEKGVYHYNVRENSLEKLITVKNIDEFHKYIIGNTFKNSAVFFVISAISVRSTVKYGNRGFRYIMIECGHLAQNLYLVSSAINLKCCGIGGFIDGKIENLLNLDGKYESVLYILAVGR